MAKQNVTVELFYSAAWHNMTTAGKVRTEAGINITDGVSNAGAEAAPATATLTFDCRDGELNPRNASSTLYGKIGQNTPIRITLGTSQQFWGEVSLWNPQKTVDWSGVGSLRGDSWTEIQAAGVLRRLGKGVDAVKSPLLRYTVPTEPLVYWPLEDGTQATQAASGLKAGSPMAVVGTMPTWANDSGLVGSQPLPKVMDAGDNDVPLQLSASVPVGSMVASPSLEFTISCWFKATGSDTSGNSVVFTLLEMTPPPLGVDVGQPWQLNVRTHGSSGAYVEFVVDATGYTFYQPGFALDGQWHHIAGQAYHDTATTITFDLFFDGEFVDTGLSTTPPYTMQPISRIDLIPEQHITFGPIDVWAGHIQYWTRADFDPVDIYNAGIGYPGEAASVRFLRLCDEAGVDGQLFEDPFNASQPMGAQRPSTLLGLFGEIERTDDGQVYDSREFLGLEYRKGVSMLGQNPALTLNYTGGQIAPGLSPVVGDEFIRNDVTAKNPDGSSGRWIQEVGTYNVQAPTDDPQGVGRYDTSMDVNTFEESRLAQVASWRVAKGTFNGTWYATATADLDAAPSLATAVNAVRIGDVVRLTNVPRDDVPGGTVDLLVLGRHQAIGSHRRMVTFNLTPAKPYDVGLLDGGGSGVLDCTGSTTNTTLTTTATAMQVLITDNCTWVHTTGDYDVEVAGEVVTVTAVGAVTGSIPSRTQTLTVTRSVNGVVKTHAVGEQVHVLDPFTPYL